MHFDKVTAKIKG